MTDQEINKAVAEYCGWSECRLTIKGAGGGTVFETAHGKPPNRKYEASCPDYTGCLNAMRVAENVTFGNSTLWIKFMEHLCDVTGAVNVSMVDAMVIIIQATAKQRAEAFLRTVKLDIPQETLYTPKS